ncbi:lysylphosphatidylglycerol synthase domain-containing protein [Streptomyces sp. NPDC002588]|uniref:lysylphosphatidylglycerol synthase domain-containing protein n=1 Tax=Streptomyces sp. NPDC002588 TaxID=3154419 RepID=UPI0033194F66
MSATGVPLPRARSRPWQLAVSAAVVVTAVWVLAAHRHTVDAGADRLAVADRNWLLAAGGAALATWVCAALAQQGAVAERLPAGRLVAAQFAACAANHLLPAGIGASAVNLRFLTRCGVSTSRSATALAVKAAVGGLVRFVLAVVLLLASPPTQRLSPVVPSSCVVAGVTGCVAMAATAVALSRPLRRHMGPSRPMWAGSRSSRSKRSTTRPWAVSRRASSAAAPSWPAPMLAETIAMRSACAATGRWPRFARRTRSSWPSRPSAP